MEGFFACVMDGEGGVESVCCVYYACGFLFVQLHLQLTTDCMFTYHQPYPTS